MTKPVLSPNYSGVTIQIMNPAVNVGKDGNANCNPHVCHGQYCTNPQYHSGIAYPAVETSVVNTQEGAGVGVNDNSLSQAQNQPVAGQAYPAQYYLNNYNYQTNENNAGGKKVSGAETTESEQLNPQENIANQVQQDTEKTEIKTKEYEAVPPEEQDFTKSQAVIADLDARALALEEEKKNTKEKKVVALTDEYIKSLENYLNNPNDEIRLMASKEILTRLDEDKDRYNDAALNALLNKMLQDPSKLIRVASLSAFASQLASGNDFTVQLLHNIQMNPNADKEDVLQAADILLKMSGGVEVKHIPNPAVKENNEQK